MQIAEKSTWPASSVEPTSLSYNLTNRCSRFILPVQNIT